MVNLIQKYLSIQNFADKKAAFEDIFQSHPDYPSLFAITDTLDLLSIENIAAKVSQEQLLELPDSFLAMYNQQLALVTKNETSIKVKLAKEDAKNLSLDSFFLGWNGIVIVIEPNETISNKYLNTDLKWLYYSLPLITLLIASIFYNNYDSVGAILLLTSIAGLVFSVFIVQEQLGYKNEMISKFCTITTDNACNSVITSQKSKINKWINFSDLPILFFGSNLTSLLLDPSTSANLIGLLSLIALPIIVYTLWIQKIELKQWCLLCLVISFVIVLQSVLWIFKKEQFSNITFSGLYFYLFSVIFIVSFWLITRHILISKIKLKKEVTKLRKLQRNYEVLNFLSNKMAVLKGMDKLEGIRFGNEHAAVRVMIVISPNCKYCNTAFREALELATQYSEKFFLKVLYNINPENNDNPYKVVVERLLEINNSNKALAAEALIDWHIKNIGLKKWKEKWKTNFITPKVNQQIERQYNWCRENEFNYTPVKILNDKLLPNEYEIIDLKYFLNNYTEDKQICERSDLVRL